MFKQAVARRQSLLPYALPRARVLAKPHQGPAYRLKRNGLDNNGGAFVSSINCIDRPPFQPVGGNLEWLNAAWIPNRAQIVYSQRTVNGALRSYAVGLDIVAHEILHGLTAHTARLEYQGMSGALNESYSDIFGIIVSNLREPDIDRWEWQMGEELTGTGVPIRNFQDPSKRNQPAHMDTYRELPITKDGDWGGVHINSGIHNKATYNILTAKDASDAYLFDARSVAALFYLALSQHLSRTSGFSDSRRAVELVARSLFRRDSQQVRDAKFAAIANAFDDVGITVQ